MPRANATVNLLPGNRIAAQQRVTAERDFPGESNQAILGSRSGSRGVRSAGTEDAYGRASGELLPEWASIAIAFQLSRLEAYRSDQVNNEDFARDFVREIE